MFRNESSGIKKLGAVFCFLFVSSGIGISVLAQQDDETPDEWLSLYGDCASYEVNKDNNKYCHDDWGVFFTDHANSKNDNGFNDWVIRDYSLTTAAMSCFDECSDASIDSENFRFAVNLDSETSYDCTDIAANGTVFDGLTDYQICKVRPTSLLGVIVTSSRSITSLEVSEGWPDDPLPVDTHVPWLKRAQMHVLPS